MPNLSPLLTDQVEHWLPPRYDVYGQPIPGGTTSHPARVILSPGQMVGPASGEDLANAGATVWLIDHPRRIDIGDRFTLPNGETLEAIRVETRTRPFGGTLHKAWLT